MLPPHSEGFIYISSIALNVQREFGEPVDHIIFQTGSGSFQWDIAGEVSPGHGREEAFDSPLNLSIQDTLTVSMRCQSQHGGTRILSIAVDLRKVTTEAQDDGHGKKEYRKSDNNFEVVIGVSSSSAPTESSHDALLPYINSTCPRYRILIIGNSGAGKSTLIRKIFGVSGVDVSHSQRGKANIDQEFNATNDMPFVIHDSLGFEAGECGNLDRVKNFINDRQSRDNLKDKLHAVWVCLAVPYAKGRFTEAGTEVFLRDRKNILGNIPVVVVLTQLDLLEKLLICRLRDEGTLIKSVAEAKPYIGPQRSKFLNDHCTQPLLKVAQGGIPHVPVSTESKFGLEPTLSELVKTTAVEIERYIKADPSYAVVTRR